MAKLSYKKAYRNKLRSEGRSSECSDKFYDPECRCCWSLDSDCLKQPSLRRLIESKMGFYNPKKMWHLLLADKEKEAQISRAYGILPLAVQDLEFSADPTVGRRLIEIHERELTVTNILFDIDRETGAHIPSSYGVRSILDVVYNSDKKKIYVARDAEYKYAVYLVDPEDGILMHKQRDFRTAAAMLDKIRLLYNSGLLDHYMFRINV